MKYLILPILSGMAAIGHLWVIGYVMHSLPMEDWRWFPMAMTFIVVQSLLVVTAICTAAHYAARYDKVYGN